MKATITIVTTMQVETDLTTEQALARAEAIPTLRPPNVDGQDGRLDFIPPHTQTKSIVFEGAENL